MAHVSQTSNNGVAILLTQGFADWEYALIAGVGKSFYGLDVKFFSPETGEVISQGGLVTIVSQTWTTFLRGHQKCSSSLAALYGNLQMPLTLPTC